MKSMLLYCIFCLIGLISTISFLHKPKTKVKAKQAEIRKVPEVHYDKVRCTIYYPYHRKKNRFKTASGALINSKDPSSSRFCALSRDLLKKFNKNAKFKYGDTVRVIGGLYSGLYKVTDCTASYIKNTIDLCKTEGSKGGLWKVLITKTN